MAAAIAPSLKTTMIYDLDLKAILQTGFGDSLQRSTEFLAMSRIQLLKL